MPAFRWSNGWVRNQPTRWVYGIGDVPTFGRILGTAEILAGISLALRPLLPRLPRGRGGLCDRAFHMVSFLLSTPGVLQPDGFPRLSTMPGQFLAKDMMFLAASIFVLRDSLLARRRARRPVRVEAEAPREFCSSWPKRSRKVMAKRASRA
ncbi:MAG: DUF417 family protein [bacterium]